MNPESQPLKYLDSIIARARLDDANLKVRQKRAGQPVPPGDSWVIYHLEKLRKMLVDATLNEILDITEFVSTNELIDRKIYLDVVSEEDCKVSVSR